ncbi:MAG: DUF1819 family protein [Thermoclostridium sp.]|nr:DUF1819 family protein [Thermoclostridium sp.]
MERKEYSAGMNMQQFWFQEFRKVLQLINEGKTIPEIKKKNLEENLFSAPTQVRAIRICNAVIARIRSLNPSFYPLFERSDITNQKLIALIAVMQNDSLFFDFMYEVFREKLIIGLNELSDSDYSIFFRDKQLQSEKVAAWTDGSLNNLRKAYRLILMEAGVTDKAKDVRKILKPIMDKALEDLLQENGMETTLHTLTGVR